MDEEQIKKEWQEIDDEIINGVCCLLQKYDFDLTNYIVHFVASVCNVEPIDLLIVSDKTYVSQSRWLLWYAIRYMTHESYERIGIKTSVEGHQFKTRSVAAGIEKMAHIIETETIWQKRWSIIKKIIKIWKHKDDTPNNEIIVNIPNNMDVKIKVKTK